MKMIGQGQRGCGAGLEAPLSPFVAFAVFLKRGQGEKGKV